MREARKAHSTKEMADLLLSNLEKLKAEVTVIEARYNILDADYTEICEDAILKINALKADLEEELETKAAELEVCKSEMSNMEARFKLGLIPAETYLKQANAANKDITTAPGGLQSIIDKVANGIELGLDKIGDGITFLPEKMSDMFAAIFKAVNQ